MKRRRILYFIAVGIGSIIFIATEVSFRGLLLLSILTYGVIAGVLYVTPTRKIAVHLNFIEKKKNRTVKVQIENKSIIPIIGGNFEIEVTNLLTEKSIATRKEMLLLPKMKKTYEFYMDEAQIGVLKAEIVVIRQEDPLMIFSKSIAYLPNSHNRDETMIIPQISERELSDESLEHYDMESYKFADYKVGNDPSESVGIRSYVQGDNIKAIHWKLSSKMSDILVRELGFPVDNRLMVIGDKVRIQDMTDEDIINLTEQFLAVSSSLIKKGIVHSTSWYDSRYEQYRVFDIKSEEDMGEMMYYLLSSPFKEDDISAVERYIAADIDKKYNSYIYVTCSHEDEKIIEQLGEYGEVNICKP